MDTTQMIVSLDLGASASKGMYSICDTSDRKLKKIELMTMTPEIARVPVSLLKETIEFETYPENVAWIANKARDEEGIAVGAFAKKYAIKGEQIENVKYEFAVDKCMAFIGAIASKHELTKTKLKIELNLLIPSDEKDSKEVIEKNLRRQLKNFYFRGEGIKCHLYEFTCLVEGTGGILSRVPSKDLKEKTIVALMLGYRNCSCLVLEHGELQATSIRLGYFDLIKSIKENAIGQRFEDLEYVIPRIEREPEQKERLLDSLIRSNRSNNQKEEKKKLIQAIEMSRRLHWQKIANWLENSVPHRLDEVLILGGASESFKQELTKYLSWVNNLDWGEETIAELKKSVKQLNNESVVRYVDVFGLHKQCLIENGAEVQFN